MSALTAVFVRGFDFGTTEQDVEGHMGTVGTVLSVEMEAGSAIVNYATAEEAQAAVSSLNRSVIAGNRRFIDVMLDRKAPPPGAGVKRSLGGESNFGTVGGNPKVLVRGFDFGTAEEQLWEHMGRAGPVAAVHFVDKGSANVIYASASGATAAIKLLNKTTIDGNSRFIDVLPGGDRAFEGPAPFQGGSAPFQGFPADGSTKVLVRGFDFGTTEEHLWAHMSNAGRVVEVHFVSNGSANVVFASPREASAALQMLDKTVIYGNQRFIDVLPGGDRAAEAKRFKGAGFETFGSQGAGYCDGDWVFVPRVGSMGKGVPAYGGGVGVPTFGGPRGIGIPTFGGKGGKGDNSDEDPVGSGRVLVRGFDFGTSDEQLLSHMSKAGPIHAVHFQTKGNAHVVYKNKASAAKAVSILGNSIIPGNSRYIDVIM
jgi:RNA recognition motif-containing protein